MTTFQEPVREKFRHKRTIVSAMNPHRWADDMTRVWLKVWFEELTGPVIFLADMFDCEPHGREIWLRSMAGEYGPMTILEMPQAKSDERLCIEHDGGRQ